MAEGDLVWLTEGGGDGIAIGAHGEAQAVVVGLSTDAFYLPLAGCQ